jgi:hypothetical protein
VPRVRLCLLQSQRRLETASGVVNVLPLASEQPTKAAFMNRNHLTWPAMFLSAVAGMFCSQIASKYTDGRMEASILLPASMAKAESGTTVALIRQTPAAADRAKD